MSSLLIMLATICVHHLHSKILIVTDRVPAKGTEIFLQSMGYSIPVIFDSFSGNPTDESPCFATVEGAVYVSKRGKSLTSHNVRCSLLCLKQWRFGVNREKRGSLIAQCSADDRAVKMKLMKRIVFPSAFMLYNPTIDVLAPVPTDGFKLNGEKGFRAIPSILYGRYNRKKETWIMKQEKRNLKARYYERALFETAEVGNGVYHIKNHLAWETAWNFGLHSSKLEKGKLFLKYNENGVTFTTGNVEECGDACKWKLVQSQVSTIATLKSKQYRVKLLYRWQPIVAFDAIAIALASETREGQAPRTLEEAG
eukprot:128531_1